MKLTKENCKASRSEKGNIYISHPQFKQRIRLYAELKELKDDPKWRSRVSLREGQDGGFYAVLAKSALEELDV